MQCGKKWVALMRDKNQCVTLHICAPHTKHTAHLCTKHTVLLHTKHTKHCTVCDKKRCNKRTLHISLYVAHCALMRGKKQGIPEHCRTL